MAPYLIGGPVSVNLIRGLLVCGSQVEPSRLRAQRLKRRCHKQNQLKGPPKQSSSSSQGRLGLPAAGGLQVIAVELAAHQPLQIQAHGAESQLAEGRHQGLAGAIAQQTSD